MNLKNYTLFCLLSFSLISCKPNYGSLTGNAYWKYNNYVGDKPDAGSEVYLFSQDTSEVPLEATCDVQGNFKFDKVETGDYMLVIKSKNTTNSAADQLQEIFTASTIKYFGFYLGGIDSTLFKNAMDSYFDSQRKDWPALPQISA